MPVPARKTINLVIIHDPDSEKVKLLKKILPLVAIGSSVLFFVLFIAEITYTNFHINQFNELKKQTGLSEGKISAKKDSEQTYTLSVKQMDSIQSVLASAVKVSGVIDQIAKLKDLGVTLSSSSIDEKGNVSISISANSYSELELFIDALILKEEKESLFRDITAQGIVRDKKGKYAVTLSLKAIISKIT